MRGQLAGWPRAQAVGPRGRPKPLLVWVTGNRSRGDDALGPMLADALRRGGAARGRPVEILEAMQLQPEDVLRLAGRRAVLLVDAARTPARAGVRLTRLASQAAPMVYSHALSPPAFWALATRWAQSQGARLPPAWMLSVQGLDFSLGEGLSSTGQRHLLRAQRMARAWCAQPPARPGFNPRRAGWSGQTAS
jgi:hydrogenase maturation protease